MVSIWHEFPLSRIFEQTIVFVALTLFRMRGGGKKAPTTSFSFVTSANVGISLKNILTFCQTDVKFQVCT